MALPALGFVKEAFFLSCFAKLSCVQLSFLIKKQVRWCFSEASQFSAGAEAVET